MGSTVDSLRRVAKEYNDAKVEKRISILFEEVMRFALSHAEMGHSGARFDVFWDNNEETRKACKLLEEEGILMSVMNLDNEIITESVLKGKHPKEHWLQPDAGIATLFLSWG